MILNIKNLFAIFIMAIMLTSCGLIPPKRYIIESTHTTTHTEIIKPDIITTSAYKNMKGEVKTIAVRAPEKCSIDSFKSGASVQTKNILSSDCGRAMAALERQLVRSGYRVISWKVIANKSENKSALTIAKNHKADILLQINTLDEAIVIAEETGKWIDEFYKTNNRGEKENITTIDAKHATFVKERILNDENRNKMLEILGRKRGATIDVTATSVKTAESVWFYKWTKLDEPNKQDQFKITTYILCNEHVNYCSEFEPYRPNNTKANNKTPIAGATSTTDSSQYTDANTKIYYKLSEEVIKDMVKHLKN